MLDLDIKNIENLYGEIFIASRAINTISMSYISRSTLARDIVIEMFILILQDNLRKKKVIISSVT